MAESSRCCAFVETYFKATIRKHHAEARKKGNPVQSRAKSQRKIQKAAMSKVQCVRRTLHYFLSSSVKSAQRFLRCCSGGDIELMVVSMVGGTGRTERDDLKALTRPEGPKYISAGCSEALRPPKSGAGYVWRRRLGSPALRWLSTH